MRLISIDVGIKNLSFCEFDKNKITRWELINVCDDTKQKTTQIPIETLVENILCKLMEYFPPCLESDTKEYDAVVIENQPHQKNGLMKTVSVVIYTYFNLLKLQHGNINKVKFVSANNKYKCKLVDVEQKSLKDYKQRKCIAIETITKYIPIYCPELIGWFHQHKKKDDLSDSALLGIHFLENKTPV
jgi:hypothetical protein